LTGLEGTAKLSLMKNFLVQPINSYNIYRICITMPNPVRNVNIYFSPDPVPTLIDTPPRGDHYLGALDAALGEIGHHIEDVERILVSHPHVDHFGCAAAIQEEANSEVWIYQGGAKALTSYEKECAGTKEFLKKILKNSGTPESLISLTIHLLDEIEGLGCKTSVSRYLQEDDLIDLASHRFKVHCVPGHTPWCTIFCEEAKEIAFSGDFLLKDSSSNPIAQSPDSVPDGYIGLKTYENSLRAVMAMEIGRLLPGHGDLIDNPGRRILELLSFMEKRGKLILTLLRPEPQTPYQIALRLSPALPPELILFAVSEVIGHLEIFQEQGIVERKSNHPLLFSLVNA